MTSLAEESVSSTYFAFDSFMSKSPTFETLNILALRFECMNSCAESTSFHLRLFNATDAVMTCLLTVFAVHLLVKPMVVSHLDVLRLSFGLNLLSWFFIRRFLFSKSIPIALENASFESSVIVKELNSLRRDDVRVSSGMNI